MKAQWITAEKTEGTVRFVKRFQLDGVCDVEKAEIAVCGLGYFTLLINGKRVSRDLFTPAQTDYAPRDLSKFTYPLFDEISHRTLYLCYEVTEFLQPGQNTVEVICGGGWYLQFHRQAEGRVDYSDKLVAAFSLEITRSGGEKQVISTDGSESYSLYPITFCNLFFGEACDTRLFDLKPTEKAVRISEWQPENLQRQTCPPDRVIRKITPKLILKTENRSLYDCGENISGLVSLKAKGIRGSAVTLNFAEEMLDGELWFMSSGSGHKSHITGEPQIQSDTFILNGGQQTLCPQFVWHCFRYFEILGQAELLEPTALVIHTDMKIASEFSCDNEILNWLYSAYIRTQLDSTHGCVPMDCPHRERLGYTGDGQICANACSTIFDSSEMYKKWIDDILDCQNKLNGHVQHTAPFMGGGGGPGGWGSAIVEVPYQHYRHFADLEVLEKCYEPQKKWIEYMLSRSEGGLVIREEEGGWCLGEWCAPKTEKISAAKNPWDMELPPEPFINTCFLICSLRKMCEIAEVLGKTEDIPQYRRIIEECSAAIKQKYMENGQYFGGSHGADAFVIWCCGEDKALFEKVVERYENAPCLDTGMFGSYILPEVLFRGGRGDIAISLLASTDQEIGFNFMINRGATTIYESLEYFDPSHCHPMFGASAALLFEGLLGIKPQSLKSGYSEVVITPCLDSLVKSAGGKLRTKCGEIGVKFYPENGGTAIEINLPETISATLKIGADVTPLKAGNNKIFIA